MEFVESLFEAIFEVFFNIVGDAVSDAAFEHDDDEKRDSDESVTTNDKQPRDGENSGTNVSGDSF